MENILKQLYNGEIFPAEQHSLQYEEYRRACQRHYANYDSFVNVLNHLDPPLDKRFIEIMDEQFDLIPYNFLPIFADGFRLGVKIMTEVFKDE